MKPTLFIPFLVFTLLSCSKSKQEIIKGQWKVSEMDLSGRKVTGDAFNISYQFQDDGKFTRTESGKTQEGTYNLTPNADSLILTYSADNITQARKIEELSQDSLVTVWEEFGMNYTEIARPVGQ